MVAGASTFKTSEPMLHELLDDIHKGVVQLPDFQRGWVWDDNHIRSLIASVSLSYPIGAVMMMETGGEGVRFKPRLIEGVKLNEAVKPELLILDGQQRLTSLYMALRSGRPVPTRTDSDRPIDRVYYLDIVKCIDPEADREEAVVSVGPDRMLKSDFGRQIDLDVSTREKEWEQWVFPLAFLFDFTALSEWRAGLQRLHGYAPEMMKRWEAFEGDVYRRFQQYKIPVIELVKATPKVAVCQVFEKVNTGGVELSVFELVTATFAADDFRLREEWESREARFKDEPLLRVLAASDFLTAVTLLASHRRQQGGKGVSCKRDDVLRLALDEYQRYAPEVERGLMAAQRLLLRERIFEAQNIPYTTQLIPLGVICSIVGERFEQEAVKAKLARWYWCGVFGQLYGSATEGRFAFDAVQVPVWIGGGEEPRTVRDASFAPVRLLSMQSRLSAAYKGLMALLLQKGSLDFVGGDSIELTTYSELGIDIHHVFPKKHCLGKKYPREKWNSVVNKAPLTAKTNRAIGGSAPSDYLAKIEKSSAMAPERLDEILRTHMIDPVALRNDAFDTFLRHRAAGLLDLIERATGKAVVGRDSEETVNAFGGSLVANAIATMP